MYYIEIFIFNTSNTKNLFLNIINSILYNLNNLLINVFFLILFYKFLIQLKNYYSYVCIIIMYVYNINSIEFNIIYDFYFGYYKIHPLVLYLGLIFLTYIITLKTHIFKFKNKNILFLLIFAFILGSLWALYQNQWGFYWSNDNIEIILLLFIIINLKNIHINFNNFFYKIFLFMQSILLLLCLRYNLLYTKHNFFQKILNINTHQYMIYIFLLLLVLIKLVKKYYIYTINFWKFILYFIIIEIFYNFINIKNFIFLNVLLVKFFLSYFSLYILICLKKKITLHLLIIIYLLIFNLFYLNIQKKTNIYISLNLLYTYNYFYYTKTFNFLLFIKHTNLWNFYTINNDLLINKLFDFNQINYLIISSIINYF